MGAAEKRSECEFDYLAAEARDARIAIWASLSDLKATLLQKADLRELAREHPRIAVGVAAAVGITAGAALIGRRGRRTRVASAPVSPRSAESSNAPYDESSRGNGRRPIPARAARGRFVKWIVGTIQGALGNALRLALESGVAAWTAGAVQAAESKRADCVSADTQCSAEASREASALHDTEMSHEAEASHQATA